MRKVSWGALFLVCFLYFITMYSLYSHMNNKWLVSPPNDVILILSILGLAIAIIGFKDNLNKSTKVRSWISFTR